jgi:hypothetical protein
MPEIREKFAIQVDVSILAQMCELAKMKAVRFKH